VLSAPASVVAGTPFDVTVRAVDAYGHTATGCNTAPIAPDLRGNLGSLGHNLIGNTSALNNSTVSGNYGVFYGGGIYNYGISAGNGFGGGIHVGAGTVIVVASEITDNQARGGDGEADGLGVGGGAYNLGLFVLDAETLIAGNHASTSHDDCFGC
jgi:hypothetical protein